MRTLVTGGAGFIGSTLVDRLLAEGHEVDVVDDLSTGSLANLAEARAVAERVPHHPPDRHPPPRHRSSCSPAVAPRWCSTWPPRPTYGCRWSGRSSTPRSTSSAPSRCSRAHGAAGTERVVFAASGGTLYGELDPAELPVRESHVHRPLSPYGVSKKAVIDYLIAYRELHSLEFCALALANVYGPRQDPHGEAGVVAIFARRLVDGHPGHHLRRRGADPGLRLRRRRGGRLRPGRRPGRGTGLQRRHGQGDLGQRPLRHHGRRGRGGRPPPSTHRPGPESCCAAASTSSGRACSSAGVRGRELADGLGGRARVSFRDSAGLSGAAVSGRGPPPAGAPPRRPPSRRAASAAAPRGPRRRGPRGPCP